MPARNKEYRLRPKARADLEGIWLYTAEHWSPKQADAYHDKIVAIMTALAAGRRNGRSAEHIREGYLKDQTKKPPPALRRRRPCRDGRTERRGAKAEP